MTAPLHGGGVLSVIQKSCEKNRKERKKSFGWHIAGASKLLDIQDIEAEWIPTALGRKAS